MMVDLARYDAHAHEDQPPPPRRMRLRSFKPLVRGALRGFCTVVLPCGLVIHGVGVFGGKKGPFALLPRKPVLDRTGRHVKPNGVRGRYAAVLEWCDRDPSTWWFSAVTELIRAKYPDALVDKPAP
jgi:hypothetical protein